MGCLSGFSNDIFISYHHGDNESLEGADSGWVTDFHRRLRVRLRQLLGVEPSIWRDKRLGGADVFPAEIETQLRRSAIILPVLTPGYLRSAWCRRELANFQNSAALTGGFQCGNVLRAIKVVKTPADRDDHRQLLPGALGCEFYEREPDSLYFREFKPASEEYDQMLDRLAQEIKRILDRLGSSPVRTEVYLAETTADLKAEREKLRFELIDRGYTVLPETPLPLDSTVETVMETARDAVNRASLCIHLFGARYGFIPDGADRSILALQYELAAESGKARLAAVLGGTQEPQPKQVEFIHSLRRDPSPQLELLEGRNIEQIKEVVFDKLKPRAVEEVRAPTEPGKTRVYLICDRQDHPLAGDPSQHLQACQLKEFLDRQGLAVWLPLSEEADSRRLRKDHKETLRICDAVLVYWGNSDHAWFREKLRELIQARGWRESRNFLAKALYITAPVTPERQAYERHEDFVFLQFDGFSPEPLAPFLRRLAFQNEASA
jgi:hypothetical protein